VASQDLINYRFTNRTGGVSTGAFASLNLGTHVGDELPAVMENRRLVSEAIGRVQYMSQVHGNRVAIIEDIADVDPIADALVTGIPGIALAVQVADCIPLLLTSKQSVAAVHVGRKGLVNGVAQGAVHVMREMGADKLSAIIGPAICGKCYEVSEEIFHEVTSIYPEAKSATRSGTFSLDLPKALASILRGLDIEVQNESSCTLESEDLFSYRRDAITGRQAGFIWL
jgi:YfiH family protein